MKKNLGSILTHMSSPSERDLEGIVGMLTNKSASTVSVSTNEILPNVFGLSTVNHKGPLPTLKQALLAQLQRIRGKELIGICNPDTFIGNDFSKVYDITSGAGLTIDINWAFYAKEHPTDAQPRFFVLTTPLLPHIIRDIKDDVYFHGWEWANWLDNWCRKTMLPHKYVDCRLMVDFRTMEHAVAQQEATPSRKKAASKRLK
jgi:hypothetical protein